MKHFLSVFLLCGLLFTPVAGADVSLKPFTLDDVLSIKKALVKTGFMERVHQQFSARFTYSFPLDNSPEGCERRKQGTLRRRNCLTTFIQNNFSVFSFSHITLGDSVCDKVEYFANFFRRNDSEVPAYGLPSFFLSVVGRTNKELEDQLCKKLKIKPYKPYQLSPTRKRRDRRRRKRLSTAASAGAGAGGHR